MTGEDRIRALVSDVEHGAPKESVTALEELSSRYIELCTLLADMAEALRSILLFHHPDNSLFYSQSILKRLDSMFPEEENPHA